MPSNPEDVMADVAPSEPVVPLRTASAAPSITVTVAPHCMIAGTGFVPNHTVTIRVDYSADDASDYLTFTTDSTGSLRAVLPTSAAAGTLRIIATDHRPDSAGACGLIWSNTATIDAELQ